MLSYFRIAVLLCVGLAAPATAHETQTSYITLHLRADTLTVLLKFDLTDLESGFGVDADKDGVIRRDELIARLPHLYEFVEQGMVLRVDYLRPQLRQLEGAFDQDDLGNTFLIFRFETELPQEPGALSVTTAYHDRFGSSFKTIGRLVSGSGEEQFVLTAWSPMHQTELKSGGPGLLRQIWAFILLGIEHIFIGIDHILFLLGLLMLGGRFIDLVKIVTSFTISHSVTLVLAALDIITLQGWLVESAIALSIVYIAIENFYLKDVDKRWILTGLMGFIHGFGFANVLGDLGLPASGLVPSLFAFNFGVEVGQIVIVAVFLPVVWWVGRTRFRREFVWASSAIILIFGATWFLDRAFGLPVAIL